MSLPALDNLARIGQLKAEPRNEAEVRRMLAMARIRLADAQLASLSAQGRFTSAYNAAHAVALAAHRCPSLAWISQRKPLHGVSVPHAYTHLACAPLASAGCGSPEAGSG